MRIAVAAFALGFMVSCSSGPSFSRHYPRYSPCGSTICILGSTETPKLIHAPMTSPTISSVVLVPLRNVRARDFREIGHGWATDGRRVWCGYPEPRGTFTDFRHLGETFYAIQGVVHDQCFPLFRGSPPHREAVPADSFAVLGCGIVRSGGDLYFGRVAGDDAQLHPIAMVDRDSFVIDARCRAHDVRFDYTIRDGVPLDARPRGSPAPELPCNYTRLNGAVFYRGRPVAEADAATFEVLTPEACEMPLARDRSAVYRGHLPLEGADAATFRIIDRYGNMVIARDEESVFFGHRRIEGADPATFERVAPRAQCTVHRFTRYYRDFGRVYVDGAPLPNADPRTFELIEPSLEPGRPCLSEGNYARDSYSVWWGRVPVEGADPTTFVVLADGSAQDRHRRYLHASPYPAKR